MERTAFAIDEAKDEEEDEDVGDIDVEDGLLEEVCHLRFSWGIYSYHIFFYDVKVDAFLEAHDSGLTGAENEAAKDLLHAPPMK